MNWGKVDRARSVELLNQLVIVYDSDLIVNRAMMILFAAICLTILYLRFAMAERPGKVENFSVLSLSTAAEGVYYDSDSFQETHTDLLKKADSRAKATLRLVPLAEVTRANEGIRANLNKLIAAVVVEFRLLRAERSLVVLMPLAIILSTLDVAFYPVVPEVSYSATYASHTANALLLFLIGIAVFYAAEAMHRDRELRIESVLWATPAPNYVLLLSKFFATLLLTLSLIAFVGLAAIVIQLLRGHYPVEIIPYLITYSVILLPSVIFLAGISLALNVVLRDRYLAYVVSIGMGGGLFYLYSIGYNHWLYNPLLYHLWKYADLADATRRSTMLMQRFYWVAIAVACVVIAHLLFERNATRN